MMKKYSLIGGLLLIAGLLCVGCGASKTPTQANESDAVSETSENEKSVVEEVASYEVDTAGIIIASKYVEGSSFNCENDIKCILSNYVIISESNKEIVAKGYLKNKYFVSAEPITVTYSVVYDESTDTSTIAGTTTEPKEMEILPVVPLTEDTVLDMGGAFNVVGIDAEGKRYSESEKINRENIKAIHFDENARLDDSAYLGYLTYELMDGRTFTGSIGISYKPAEDFDWDGDAIWTYNNENGFAYDE